jgi:hypothetical protein
MSEPQVTRATLRIEYSDGQVREADVPEPRDVKLKITGPDLPPLFGDLDYSYRIPPVTQAWRVEMSMDATPSRRDARRSLITVSEKAYVLDPALMPFLDWPLYFPDDSVQCNKFPECGNRFCRDPDEGQVYIVTGRRMTVREFLADVKKHAEET